MESKERPKNMSDTGRDDDLRVDSVEKEDSTSLRRFYETCEVVVFVNYVRKEKRMGKNNKS
jgi:hypothetical protein